MKPMYQARKKIVAGQDERLRLLHQLLELGRSLDRLPVDVQSSLALRRRFHLGSSPR